METHGNHYIKNGIDLIPTPSVSLDVRKSLPPGVYTVAEDPNTLALYFKETDSFTTPKRVYGDTIHNRDRIFRTFLERPQATGVLLTGTKGSGKSLLAKMLCMKALEQGIPTILINAPWRGDKFNRLIQGLTQPAIVLFEEIEKVYPDKEGIQEELLTLLDGVFPTKKMFVFTSNSKYKLNENMLDRPGRLFYCLEYSGLDKTFISEYCQENLVDKSQELGVVRVSSLFTEFNFDLLQALVEEMNRYNENALESLLFLNATPSLGRETFSIEVKVKGVKRTTQYHNGRWFGNPLNGWSLCVDKLLEEGGRGADSPDYDEDEDAVVYTFLSTDLKRMEPESGIYEFAQGEVWIRLTKVQEKSFSLTNGYGGMLNVS